MDRIVFEGIIPALVTPVNEDGSIRAQTTRNLVKGLSGTGITGFYILGGTGEGVALDRDVRMEFAETVMDCLPEGLQVVDHIAAADLPTVKLLARHARRAGVHGIASVPPFFYKYNEAGIIDYYRAMSDASEGLPMLVYASPLVGEPLPLSTVEKLLDIPGFVGMKYTNSDYYRLSRYKKLAGGDINIINGPDETCALGLLMGADGAIGSTYNNMPRTFVGIYNAVRSGDIARAMELQRKANEIIEILLRFNVVAAVKAALELEGYDIGGTVRPLPEISSEGKRELFAALKAQGFPGDY